LLSAAGLALKKSYQANGELEALNDQWQYANEISIQAFNNQKAENEKAQQRMIERENSKAEIQEQLNEDAIQIEALRGNGDASCVNDEQWLLIENSAGYSTSSGLPGNQSSTTANN
jgi:hypothetical protein